MVRALEGKDVVRLKGGDPFVFGRGGEEAEELAAARVPFEVVPGISAALGAAAAAGIPLTHRECAASVTLVTAHAAHAGAGHEAGDGASSTCSRTSRAKEPSSFTWASVVSSRRARRSSPAGASPETPAAVMSRATLPDARMVVGTLADIAPRVREANLEAPALLIVGEVVARRVTSPAALADDALRGEQAL